MQQKHGGPDPESPFLIHQELFRTASAVPESPALRFKDTSLNYRHYARCVGAVAAGLRTIGVTGGSKVALYLPNSAHYAVSFYGVLAAGATVVNLSPLDPPAVLAKKMRDAGAGWLVAFDTPAFGATARALARDLRVVLVLATEQDFALAATPATPPMDEGPAALRYVDLLRTAQEVDADGAGQMEDIAVLQYTGGTTGEPKAAMLLHRNLAVASNQLVKLLNACRQPLVFGQESVLLSLPLFHIFAINAGLMLAMRYGAELVIQERFDAAEALKLVEDRRISVFGGVPTMFIAMLAQPGIQDRNLRSLKFCTGGGAPLLEETATRFLSLTGVWLTDGWGMTESCGMGTLSPLGEAPRMGSCGLPVPGLELELRDLDDVEKQATFEGPGQICIRGPNVMAGYWQRPEATRMAFTSDGFFMTGDVGTRDPDGHVRIVDRLKDMLLCGGFNVYPRTIEEAISEHPDVAEVCVVGVPDPYRGQSPKAFVTTQPGRSAPSLAELKQFLATRLGKHEMVQHLEVRSALPRTPVGKLSRRALQEEADRAA